MAADPYRYFRIEAREIADQVGRDLLDLEKAPAGRDLVAKILRSAHTLKGAARVVKQREIADHAHHVEEVLAPFRDGQAPVSQEAVARLFALLDEVSGQIARIESPAPSPTAVAPKQHEEPVRTVRADLAEMDALLDGLAETQVHVNGFRRGLASVERVALLSRMLLGEIERRRGAASGDAAIGRRALGMAEELKTLSAGLERGLIASVEQMDRELRQARDAAEQLRLVPVSTIFTALERTARDAARELGKEVSFEASGGEVRLDAHVIDRVQPALVQAVRNAVAHGIEDPTKRAAAKKRARGKIVLAVARRGRRVSFQVSDDGAGVDLEAVRHAARKADKASDVSTLRDEDLLDLLLRGGISTSPRVTEVAGRGVGLDVVRAAAMALGGVASIRTEHGSGTHIEISVPLSVAALEGLVVEQSGFEATIPLDSVRHAMRVAPSSVTRTPAGESVVHEGKVIPFVALGRALQRGGERREIRAAVVVEGSGALAAIGVDRVLGTANVVLRPLPTLARSHDVIAGASLDTRGTPKLVLDPDALVVEASKARAGLAIAEPEAPLPLLVIDDSLTTRMLERSILESAGYEVDVAVSGEEGLLMAAKRSYGLFLVDVEMPGMTGFEFIERAKADATLHDVPAVLVTSRASDDDRKRGVEVGAQGHVAKGEFDQAELLGLISRLTRRA